MLNPIDGSEKSIGLKSYEFDLFLSHSSKNKQTARMLALELKHAGLKVWFDEWLINLGDDVYLEIERGLEKSRSMLILMSKPFFESDWATFERATALFHDPSSKSHMLFPVVIDDCAIPKSLARLKHFDLTEVTPPRLDGLIHVIASRLKVDIHRALHYKKIQGEKSKDDFALKHRTDRVAFGDIVELAILNKQCLLMYFDVDGFTFINARYGVAAAERILEEIIRLLETNAPTGSFVGRWHADEFVVAIPNIEERVGLEIAEGLVDLINCQPWESIEESMFVSISCGVAAHVRRSTQLHVEWVERAILGARSAKIKGGGKARLGEILKSSPSELARKSIAPLEYLRVYTSD
jgi:diguanylate cyclase (GGDEF)-like protein